MDTNQTNTSQKLSYESLWKAIIRPPRDIYNLDELGPVFFKIKNKNYIRKDFEILDFRGLLLKLSIIEPEPSCRPSEIMPMVIYLHANASSRIEGLNTQKYLLKHDINLCIFDFEGCGLSEGEYISLGFHEKNQVKNVVNLIEKYKGVGNIGIWGRSMGAVTALLYASMDDRIKCLVVDSPFCDFRRLAKETCLKQIKVPGFLVEGAISIIGKSVFNKNGMKINEIKAIDAVKNCQMPVIFIHAYDDELVAINHSEELINNYAGNDKVLKTVHGGHNGKRPMQLLESVGLFFRNHLINDGDDNNNNMDLINDNDNCVNDGNENLDDDELIYTNFPKNRGQTIYDDLKINDNNKNNVIKMENNDDNKKEMTYGFACGVNQNNNNNYNNQNSNNFKNQNNNINNNQNNPITNNQNNNVINNQNSNNNVIYNQNKNNINNQNNNISNIQNNNAIYNQNNNINEGVRVIRKTIYDDLHLK